LDGAPFVATPVLQRKQPNNPAAMSPVAASASIQFNSIQFSPDGHFHATAGCNRLFGRQERVYPDFKLGPIGSTRMGCTTSAEQVFTSALATMTKARREDKQLILSNNAGREMLFNRY
jgi:heat shock protein HslJ